VITPFGRQLIEVSQAFPEACALVAIVQRTRGPMQQYHHPPPVRLAAPTKVCLRHVRELSMRNAGYRLLIVSVPLVVSTFVAVMPSVLRASRSR